MHPDESAQVSRTTRKHEPYPGVRGWRENLDDQGQTHEIYTNAAIYLRPSGGTKWCNRLTSQGCGTKRGLCLHRTVTMGRQFYNYQSCSQRNPQCFPFHCLNTFRVPSCTGFVTQPDFNIETQTGPCSHRWYVSAQSLPKATWRLWDMTGIKNTGYSVFALGVFYSEWKLWSTQLLVRWSCN